MNNKTVKTTTEPTTDTAIRSHKSELSMQSCPWVGLTRGFGWVGSNVEFPKILVQIKKLVKT